MWGKFGRSRVVICRKRWPVHVNWRTLSHQRQHSITTRLKPSQTAPSLERCRLLISDDMQNAICAVEVTGVLWLHYGQLSTCMFFQKHSENSITVEKTRRNKDVMFHSVWICLNWCSIVFVNVCVIQFLIELCLCQSISISISKWYIYPDKSHVTKKQNEIVYKGI